MKFVKLEVLTYVFEEAPSINYASLGLPEPNYEKDLSWQTRAFNLDLLEDELIMVYSEVEDQVVFRFYDDRTIIVRGTVDEIINLLQ